MDYIYPDKPFQNTINVLAASILKENSSDIETTLIASKKRLRQVQSWREIGVLFSTERDPNRLEKRVRESHLSPTGGKSDVSQPNRGTRIDPYKYERNDYKSGKIFEPVKARKHCCHVLFFKKREFKSKQS
ncbi:hypothetical protein AVEN_17205-1 [Araneus ventricosus]|uniref:Uncharacterized protein n=1 Tax=Araneus ventricosus TaxID=182803 RepID=A0A4Y1ZRZ0_ARAVE|nr:hypothetical protein AVEN_5101-1 [Araneus ventricosus]GBL65137.1 hypothetical protein AVEN_17205-1 [Araneus ventricosus]